MIGDGYMVLILLASLAVAGAWELGRYQGRRERIRRLGWRVEQTVGDGDWVTAKDLRLSVVRGGDRVYLGSVDVKRDGWEDELRELAEQADDRAAGLNAHLGELPG